MSVLKLVRYDHPAIVEPAKKFDFTKPPFDPVQFALDLSETMNAHTALGIAAPQVGVPYRIIAVPQSPNLVMFNPIIVDRSTEVDEREEGCLTYPGLILKMTRALAVKVRFALPNGEVKTEKYAGMTARVIQHECDHLEGRTILTAREGVSRYMAQKKWSKIVSRTGGAPASNPREIQGTYA